MYLISLNYISYRRITSHTDEIHLIAIKCISHRRNTPHTDEIQQKLQSEQGRKILHDITSNKPLNLKPGNLIMIPFIRFRHSIHLIAINNISYRGSSSCINELILIPTKYIAYQSCIGELHKQ